MNRLVVSLEFLKGIFRLGWPGFCDRHALQIRHEEIDGGLELFRVDAFHFLEDKSRIATLLLHTTMSSMNFHF